MNIREANSDTDLTILAKMNHSLILDEGHRNTMDESKLQERMKLWLKGEYEAVIIAEERKDIGYALWREDDDYLYIRQFYVKPEYRRMGFGRNAIHWLMKNKWHSGLTLRLDVLIGNESGSNFWKNVGFEDYCVTMEYKNA